MEREREMEREMERERERERERETEQRYTERGTERLILGMGLAFNVQLYMHLQCMCHVSRTVVKR